MIPASQFATEIVLELVIDGNTYTNTTTKISSTTAVDTTIELTKTA